MKALTDQSPIPFRTVLVFQLDEEAFRIYPSWKASSIEAKESHQGKSLGPCSLRMIAQKKRQAQGLITEVFADGPIGVARVVALAEEQVKRLVHGLQPPGDVGGLCELYEPSRLPKDCTGAPESLFDRVLAGQEGTGDLGHAETAKGLEDEGHLHLGGQCR